MEKSRIQIPTNNKKKLATKSLVELLSIEGVTTGLAYCLWTKMPIVPRTFVVFVFVLLVGPLLPHMPFIPLC